MQLFNLVREQDVSGVSGTGVVAEGCLFSNGKVALSWLGEHRTLELFDYIEEVEELHGHGGMTRVVWLERDATKVCFCDLYTRDE